MDPTRPIPPIVVRRAGSVPIVVVPCSADDDVFCRDHREGAEFVESSPIIGQKLLGLSPDGAGFLVGEGRATVAQAVIMSECPNYCVRGMDRNANSEQVKGTPVAGQELLSFSPTTGTLLEDVGGALIVPRRSIVAP